LWHKLHKSELKAFVITATIEPAAARKTGDAAPNPTHAREISATLWTPIKERPHPCLVREGQCVAALLACNAKIAARLSPFQSMRLDAPPTRAVLGKQMSQLVQKCSLDLGLAVLTQPRIQRDQLASIVSASRRSAEPAVPFHGDTGRDPGRA